MFNLRGGAPAIEKPHHVAEEEGLNLQPLLRSLRRVPLDKLTRDGTGGNPKSHDETLGKAELAKKKRITIG